MTENNSSFPNEEQTQTLNQMAADIKTLILRVENLEIEVVKLSKRTNADFLAAFAEMFKTFSEDLKTELKAELKAELTF